MVFLDYLALGIGIVGVAVITWGVAVSLGRLVVLELGRLRGRNICGPRETLRHHLGSYLLLGLEILVAADVVHTIQKPGLQEIAVLGAIVAIRTVLNFFLNKEMGNHRCGPDTLVREGSAAAATPVADDTRVPPPSASS